MTASRRSQKEREGEMEKVIMGGKVPLKLWLNDIEDGALAQAVDLTKLETK